MFPQTSIDQKAPVPIPVTKIEGGRYVIDLQNGRKAELKRLNGYDQLKADALCGDTMSGMQVSRTYGICMLTKIDGIEVAPLSNNLEFQNVSESLTAGDTTILARVYGQLESPEDGAGLKNA